MNDIGGGLDGRLAEGTQINGTLRFERAVQIDGRFEGNVKSPGKLILGPTAQVDADIVVGELEVQGTLRGKVQAKSRLTIRDGGVVEANIVTGKLAIETGAVFRGSCEMPDEGGSDAKPQPKPAPEPAAKPSKAVTPPPKPNPAG
ncbi:MAG: polymer-forming cytoskeletal protein [Acidobacteriota bacterium]|jgi:cytoskeletal protein CcmA (bactofilin family)